MSTPASHRRMAELLLHEVENLLLRYAENGPPADFEEARRWAELTSRAALVHAVLGSIKD